MNQRDASKKQWLSDNSIEHINSGALQRIADATELMASGYVTLQNDRDNYKRWYYQEQERRVKLEKRIVAYKGVVTKLKKR